MVFKKYLIGIVTALLIVCMAVVPAGAATGDNLIPDPNFNSVQPSGSFWKYTVSGGTGSLTNGGNVQLTLGPRASGNIYITSVNRIMLQYADEVSITNTLIEALSSTSVGGEYSPDGTHWYGMDKITSGGSGKQRFDVSDVNELCYIRFTIFSYNPDASYPATFKSKISAATATDARRAPTYSSTDLPQQSVIAVGEPYTITVHYIPGVPAVPTTAVINWGEGNDVAYENDVPHSHTYSNVGTYTLKTYGTNGEAQTPYITITTITVVPKITSVFTTGATFVSGAATITPGTSMTFYANYNGQIPTADSFYWSIGETVTQGNQEFYQTFNTPGTYEVKVRVNSIAGYSQWYTVGTVYVGTSSVTFDNPTYTQGDTAQITWSLNNPDYSENYNLQIFQSDSTGITVGSSVITPVAISSSVTSYDWSTAGASGYYVAKIYKGTTSEVARSSVANVQTAVTLTVTLSMSSVTWTNSTVVTLYKDGVQAYQQTTTTGQAVFNNVISGTYTVTAETMGYASQSATISLSESYTINIDFVTGSTGGGASSGGAGGAYSVTYVTFRVIDRNTGATVPGAHIFGSAIDATNPLEWLVNWFGPAYGNAVIGTEISGYSDDNGVVSFVMYPNLRYSLSLEHSGLAEPSTRTFSPSSLNAEYPWYITFPDQSTSGSKNIKVTVNVSDEGLVSAHYTDLSLSTSTVTMQVLTKDDDGAYNVTMGSDSGGGNNVQLESQLSGYSGKDIKIVITSQTTAYGQVTKVYYHTFIGPWLDIGLPNDIYIWICLLTAILIGGVATFINSYAACFVIVFFEWIYWFFGWFFQIGQFVVLPLLIFATVLSILFYMQSRK